MNSGDQSIMQEPKYPAHDYPSKKQKLHTDFELHEGWIETCRNEKRSYI